MTDDAGHEVRRCVIAIDAGTTGVRSRAIFADGGETAAAYQEFAQIFPRPGWVEHDAEEIWRVARSTLTAVVERVGLDSVAAIGIANQRETVVAWNRRSGKPYGTGDRLAGPPHRRPLRRTRATMATSRWSARSPGWCSTRTSRRRSSNGC